MDKHVDLTDDGVFSHRQIHKVLVKGRLPWDNWAPSSWILNAFRMCFKDTDVCERCGSDIRELPWDKHYGLCENCERLVSRPRRFPWKDPTIKDEYRNVFLTEFMDVRRNHQ